MKNIFLQAYTSLPRQSAITLLQQTVSRFGSVVDFKLFSDLSMSATIELEERNIDPLCDALKSIFALDDFEAIASKSTRERTIFLNLTFSTGTGEQVVEVPAVPG